MKIYRQFLKSACKCSRGNAVARNDSFGYNSRSELTSVNIGNGEYAYAFDTIGNRLTAEELALETQYTTNNLNQYLTKNVCELIDTNLEIAQTYDYAPFGAVTVGGSAITNPFQFSSEVHDSELALNYYNYRHYNPADGRWLSRDPIEEQGGLNLYAFVANSILNDFDLIGFNCCAPGAYNGNGSGWWVPPSRYPKPNYPLPPSIFRHINPFGCFDDGKENSLDWLLANFNNSIKKREEEIVGEIYKAIACSANMGVLPSSINSVQKSIAQGDLINNGDRKMNLWEEYFLLGSFYIGAKNISVTWTGCRFSGTGECKERE